MKICRHNLSDQLFGEVGIKYIDSWIKFFETVDSFYLAGNNISVGQTITVFHMLNCFSNL